MAKYFLHLRDGTDELLDVEGSEFPDMESVRRAVLKGARGIMSHELGEGGMVDLRYRIDAENDRGEIVYSLPFKHAVNIIPAMPQSPRRRAFAKKA